ncbi:ROK family protein [Spirillospora sp. CA-255316]
MNTHAPLLLALDVGGTHIRASLLRGQETLSTLTRPSARDDERPAADGMLEILNAAAKGRLDEVEAIGFAIAGPVDVVSGAVTNPFTLPGWSTEGWIEDLRARLGIPIVVENDAMSAALGEFHDGAGRGAEVMCMITLGTGIGVAIVSAERGPYRGSGGFHPEAGHLIVGDTGTRCYCGESGCWEELCSGRGIRRYWTTGTGRIDWDGYGRALARGVRNLSRVYAADRFVFGGGISRNFADFAPALRTAFASPDPMGLSDIPGLRLALLGDPGLRGAAHLAARVLTAKECA